MSDGLTMSLSNLSNSPVIHLSAVVSRILVSLAALLLPASPRNLLNAGLKSWYPP